MTDENLLRLATEISEKARLPAFPTGKAESSLINFYSKRPRLVKVQIHKLRHTLQKRFSKITKSDPDVLDYISFIYAIADAKAYIGRKKSMNIRYMGVQDPEAIPDFEKAIIQDELEKHRHKGPRKSTQEALLPHRRIINRMISENASSRKIASMLESKYGVKISHTTITRNMELIKKS